MLGSAFVNMQKALTINARSSSPSVTLKALKNIAESMRANDSRDAICILDKWESSDICFNHVIIAADDDVMMAKVSAKELNTGYGW